MWIWFSFITPPSVLADSTTQPLSSDAIDYQELFSEERDYTITKIRFVSDLRLSYDDLIESLPIAIGDTATSELLEHSVARLMHRGVFC